MLGDKYIFFDEVIRFISEHEKKKDYEAGTCDSLKTLETQH